LDIYGNVDSKYRFVILAAKRAKQLLRGAKPKIKARSRNLIRIAQAEVQSGLIEYEVLPERLDEAPDTEDRVFAVGGMGEEIAEAEPADVGGDEPAADEEETVEDEEGEEAEEESAEDLGDEVKEDKDE
jgi:DNA-directed RNA polymerase omega subunit